LKKPSWTSPEQRVSGRKIALSRADNTNPHFGAHISGVFPGHSPQGAGKKKVEFLREAHLGVCMCFVVERSRQATVVSRVLSGWPTSLNFQRCHKIAAHVPSSDQPIRRPFRIAQLLRICSKMAPRVRNRSTLSINLTTAGRGQTLFVFLRAKVALLLIDFLNRKD